MTEADYADIAGACDRLLRAPDTSLGRVAVPLLHMINEHPGWLAQYAPLLRQERAPADWRTTLEFLDSPRAMLRAARALRRSLAYSLGHSADSLAQVRHLEGTDVLIVSHLSSAAQVDVEDDVYFGALQRLLSARGVRSMLVLIDHLTCAPNISPTRQFSAPRLLLSRTVTPRLEAGIWHHCADVSRSLRHTAQNPGRTLEARVAMLASRQALSVSTAANLRLHASLSEVCRLLNPRIVMTTYEGDACERIIWHAARSADRRPLCVGYQHSRLFARAHAISRAVNAPGIDCDPDVILTLGEISHTRLAASSQLGRARLIEYGSHRRLEPAVSPGTTQRQDLCLVLPDADDRETRILFEFALDCARLLPQMMFALRPHPSVAVDVLYRRYPVLRDLPDNVTLSTGSTLEQTCARARYCLYRGSSAAVHAVLAGVKPFYVARAGELPFDPLFALEDWRETIASPEHFVAGVAVADASPDAEAAQIAWNICDRTIAPVRAEALDELLGMVSN